MSLTLAEDRGVSMAARAQARSFLDAYLAGTPDEVPVPAPPRPPRGPALAPPLQAFALRGCLLTRDGPLDNTWLVIVGGRISAIKKRRPAGVPGVDTHGVILPGLIDLHGHPEFNVFAAWEPPKQYINRYAWRASAPYKALVRTPQDKLQAKLPRGTQLRYAEIRALVGGVTAMQGASGTNRATDESLVRNVDLRIFGQHRARAMIDLPSGPRGRGADTLRNVLAGIANGSVDAFYLHLAEGARNNQRSINEFDRMVKFDALTPATVIIHGTALTVEQLGHVRDAGAKLVWSPQSNLRLYGETTRAAEALRMGLPVALGADWLPSGSTSLLAEMKVARQELANQGFPISARSLVNMVTEDAAKIAGLSDHLGVLAEGRVADVVVIRRRSDDPYETVVNATPEAVELVTIGSDLAYGRADWIKLLALDPMAPSLEPVLAWGKQMMLDTSYHAAATASTAASPPLTQLRADLTRVYPPVGPIWA